MVARKRQTYRHLPAFILLVLAEGEAHGGAIHSRLHKVLPHFQSDAGAVYRSLQQLENENAVESHWDTSESGPARKIYRLTSAGWDKLAEWDKEIEGRVANLTYFLNTFDKIRRQTDRSE